jgi:hypothetical protein
VSFTTPTSRPEPDELDKRVRGLLAERQREVPPHPVRSRNRSGPTYQFSEYVRWLAGDLAIDPDEDAEQHRAELAAAARPRRNRK